MAASAVRRDRALLLALGGNAIIPEKGEATARAQWGVAELSMGQVADLVKAGLQLVLTHGNGPVVGNILLRNEMTRDLLPPMTLDICGADSQGGIGYMLQQSLLNALRARGLGQHVATVITQVEVDPHDPAFTHPTKPIGPFFSKTQADQMREQHGWHITNDANRGFRRVVPSPKPRQVLEAPLIRALVDEGAVVIAGGGGGIPVVCGDDGKFHGVEAVIDKDHTAATMAQLLGIPTLALITGVEQVAVHFGTPQQRALGSVGLSEIARSHAEGHFPPGRMGPKMEAAISFLEHGGERVLITTPEKILEAMEGRAGTQIVRDDLL